MFAISEIFITQQIIKPILNQYQSNIIKAKLSKQKPIFVKVSLIMHSENQFRVEMKIDPQNDRYPFCMVWTSLPCITCCFPCIGHTGICKSDGTIYDFVGRGPMHHGQLAFGSPLKYLVLDHDEYTNDQWDESIMKANAVFQKTDHNIVVNNCHHHVAEVLNNLKYQGKQNWGQVDIALLAIKATHRGFHSFYIYAIFLVLTYLIFF